MAYASVKPTYKTEKPPKKAIYVSGPMTGLKSFNFPAFDRCAAYYRKHGWKVFSPAENDRRVHPGVESDLGFATGDWGRCTYDCEPRDLFRWDMNALADSDAIVMLPGWERSKGAQAEKTIAEWIGLDVLYYHPRG